MSIEIDPFYEKLKTLNAKIAVDFSDEGSEGNPTITLWEPRYVDSNFPWLYVKFELDGPLSLYALKEIEKRYLAFCALEGGSLETIHLNRRGPGFVVKLVYVGKK